MALSMNCKFAILVCLYIFTTVSGSPLFQFKNVESADSEDVKSTQSKEDEAINYLTTLRSLYSEMCNNQQTSQSKYATNGTPENEQKLDYVSTEFQNFHASVQKHIRENYPNWKSFDSDEIKQDFQVLTQVSTPFFGDWNQPEIKTSLKDKRFEILIFSCLQWSPAFYKNMDADHRLTLKASNSNPATKGEDNKNVSVIVLGIVVGTIVLVIILAFFISNQCKK